MPGVLKVKDPADPTGNTWIEVAGIGGDGPPGVIGPTGPTGETGPAGAGAAPPGGAANQALTKVSGTDGDTRWGGDVSVGDVTMAAGKKILFPTEVGDKLVLYNAASGSRFGFSILSGTLCAFVEQVANKIAFHVGGTERAYFDQNGLGPRTTTNVTWANGFSGTMDFHKSPAMITMRMTGVSRNANTAMGTQTKICDYPSGITAPPLAATTGWRFAIPVHNATFDMGNNTQHQGATLHLDGSGVWVIPTGDVLYDADVLDAVISWPR
jgi:hypothetical protein